MKKIGEENEGEFVYVCVCVYEREREKQFYRKTMQINIY
jgi:hypothetical protein